LSRVDLVEPLVPMTDELSFFNGEVHAPQGYLVDGAGIKFL
jgi:hypothetical protein